MDSENFIKKLSEDLKPFRPLSESTVAAKAMGLFLLFFIPSLILMPWREDLAVVRETWTFGAENFLWAFLVASSLWAFKISLRPDTRNVFAPLVSAGLVIALVILSLLHTPIDLAQEIPFELDLWRGRCGLVITALTLIQTPVMISWAKNFAPRESALTGVSAALSSSALGCLLMQVICFHPESTHLMLWHFFPLMGLSLISGIMAKRFLRW